MAFLLLAVTVFFPACGNTSASDTIASSFLNQYYVNVDLSQAKKLTDGLATRKIEQEEALLEGVGRGREKRRDTSYRLLQKREEGERVAFLYELMIEGRGVPTLKKRLLLSVAKVDGAWRITNFSDFDT